MASEKAAARHFLAHQLVHGFGCEARHILLRSAPVFRLEALEGSAPKNKSLIVESISLLSSERVMRHLQRIKPQKK